VAGAFAIVTSIFPLPIPEEWKASLTVFAWMAFALTCVGWLLAHTKLVQRLRSSPKATKPMTLALIAVSGGILFAIIWLLIPKPDGEKKHESTSAQGAASFVEPKFPDDIDDVRITVNGFDFPRNVVILEQGGLDLTKGTPLGAPTIPNGRVYTDNRKPYFDGTIVVGLGKVEIRRNRITKLPEGWDQNANDRAYEVVNERRRVVFQFVLESAEHVIIDAGQWINNENQWNGCVFKYPSSEHPGELLPDAKPLPLTAKTLYQFFLSDCGTNSTGGIRTTRNLAGKFQVERIVCRNQDTKAAYLSVFIPQGNVEPVIEALASEFKEIVNEEDRAGFSRGTIFTGRIFIYHESRLFDRQIESLTAKLKDAGADPVFYGPDEQVKRNSPLYQR
jgi:hypothetical protein